MKNVFIVIQRKFCPLGGWKNVNIESSQSRQNYTQNLIAYWRKLRYMNFKINETLHVYLSQNTLHIFYSIIFFLYFLRSYAAIFPAILFPCSYFWVFNFQMYNTLHLGLLLGIKESDTIWELLSRLEYILLKQTSIYFTVYTVAFRLVVGTKSFDIEMQYIIII